MIFYDLPGDIKLYIASYILGHSKIIKLKIIKFLETFLIDLNLKYILRIKIMYITFAFMNLI